MSDSADDAEPIVDSPPVYSRESGRAPKGELAFRGVLQSIHSDVAEPPKGRLVNKGLSGGDRILLVRGLTRELSDATCNRLDRLLIAYWVRTEVDGHAVYVRLSDFSRARKAVQPRPRQRVGFWIRGQFDVPTAIGLLLCLFGGVSLAAVIVTGDRWLALGLGAVFGAIIFGLCVWRCTALMFRASSEISTPYHRAPAQWQFKLWHLMSLITVLAILFAVARIALTMAGF